MKETVVVCISTPSKDQHNFFRRMIKAHYPGSDRKIFGTIDFKLYCNECERRRLTACHHRKDLQPAWKGVTKFEVAEVLYGEDFKSYHMRETMGAVAHDDNRLFDMKWIDLLEARPLWERQTRDCQPSHIFLSVDPNAGGTSRMAIISLAYVMGVVLVVGMDAHPCHNSRQADELLRSHLEGLKKDRFLCSAWIVMVYEKNTGYESGRHFNLVSEYQPMYALYDRVMDADKARGTIYEDPGITTTHTLKNKYARELMTCLRESKIFFYTHMVVGNSHSITIGGEKTRIRREFVQELRQCRVKYTDVDPDKIDLGATRLLIWNGKMDALGKPVPGNRDDLVVCFAQGVYWMLLVSSGKLVGFPYADIYPNGTPEELSGWR